MEPWSARPFEIANNLNPAFCSIIIFDAIGDYENVSDHGMEYSLSFLILPIVLHRRTRIRLPRTIRSRMHVWIQEKPEIRVGFAQRVSNLIPITRETLCFGLQNGLYQIDINGKLISMKNKVTNYKYPDDSEPYICRQKARFLGRWFANSGETRSIFTMWGIRP